ncbi:MAG: acyltransferase [Rhodobacteraceae bacterium]|nr:acyltransferase [Paracoccaceae bacterium]
MSASPQGYRREIDGLRAIAVLAVVFYHFSVPGFGGGFVGVDVFFVISGFLIGGILWRELVATGRLSLARFYTHRLRRLAPAFVAMALVSGLAAYFILLPYEFREFGKALIASTVYLSNVLFFRQSGYFDSAADEKLLLHTWSLSVEEQFYIFLPLTILIFARSTRILYWVLMLVFALSLLACILFTRSSPTAAFYLFPFRAWEMLAGVLLAIYGAKTQEDWRHGPLPSFVGILLVLGGIGLVQAGEGFPGWQVMAPVFGAVLLIWNGRDYNLVNRMLASPVPVFIGLVSYSLYLWHWPILTLTQYYFDGYSGGQSVVWMVIALGIAVVSWRFVELPLRRSHLKGPLLLAGVGLASFTLLGLGALIYLQNGMPDRFGPKARMHIDASADFLQDWSRCYWPEDGPLQGVEVCPIGPDGPPEVLVWGDSHVRAFQAGIALAAQEHKRSGLLIWHAGCPPLFGITKQESAATPLENADCTTTLQRMQGAVGQLPGIRKLLVIGRWAYYAKGAGVGNDAHNTIALRGGALPDVYGQAVNRTFGQLAENFDQVFVLQQVPEIPQYDSREFARKLAHGRLETDAALTVPVEKVKTRTGESEAPFRALDATGKLTFLESWGMMCTGQTCSAVADGRALYFDNNHITNTTALQMRGLFDPVFGPEVAVE